MRSASASARLLYEREVYEAVAGAGLLDRPAGHAAARAARAYKGEPVAEVEVAGQTVLIERVAL